MPLDKPSTPLNNKDDPKMDARYGELGQLRRPSGGISTELSITITDERLNNGEPTNIPLLVKGQKAVNRLLEDKPPSKEQIELAIKRAVQRKSSGQILPSYKSISEAVKEAKARTEEEKMRIYQ